MFMFAVVTDPFTATDLASVIPAIWPGLVLEELFAKAVAARWFEDLTEYMREQGNIAHIADVYTNTFALQSQGTQGAEVTTNSPAQNDIQLAINTHDYVAFIIGDKDARQLLRAFDFNMVYTKKAAGTLRHALEDALFGLWSGLSTNVVGDTATVLSDAEIRTGIFDLENGNFDTLDGDSAFFFHPYTFYVQLGATQKYYDQAQRGPLSAAGFVATGMMGTGQREAGLKGTLYGIPLYTSTRVVSGLQTYRNLLAHKSAFGFATQYQQSPLSSTLEDNRVRAQTSYELRNLGWLTVVDMIFGTVELRDAAAVVLNGSSTFIGS
jgi:hypothetical protein